LQIIAFLQIEPESGPFPHSLPSRNAITGVTDCFSSRSHRASDATRRVALRFPSSADRAPAESPCADALRDAWAISRALEVSWSSNLSPVTFFQFDVDAAIRRCHSQEANTISAGEGEMSAECEPHRGSAWGLEGNRFCEVQQQGSTQP
jgi:hypothetical protein